MRCAELCHGLVVLGLRLLQRDLIVAGIKFDERLSRVHDLVVVDVDSTDGTVDARGDRVQMAVDLRVIGVLVAAGVEIVSGSDGDQHEGDDAEDERVDAAARSGCLRANDVSLVCSGWLCLGFDLRCCAHLLAPFD